MATDPLTTVRSEVRRRVAEIRNSGPRLSPLDLYARMDAIRKLAVVNGLAALETLARSSAQHALLPGHRLAAQVGSIMSRMRSTAALKATAPRSSRR